MHQHSHLEKSDHTQLLESINALTKAITDFNDSEQRHHDSLINSFQSLKAQITHNPHSSPTLTLQLLDGSNSLVFQQELEPDSQQLTVQGGDVTRVDGFASFSPIAVTDSPSEGPHLSIVHLRPTFPRTPSYQDLLHKLVVTASNDPDSHFVLLPNPSDQMLHAVGTKIQAAGGAVIPPPPPDAKPQGDDHVSLPAKSTSAGVFEDASIPDTGPYDSGPFNSPTPATEVTLHRGQVDSARNLFDKMHKKDVASCKSIHSYGVRRYNCGVGPNSLPAMYSKCGEEYLVHRIFDRTLVYNDISWLTMMARILKDYVGRESTFYFVERWMEHYKKPNGEGTDIYMKREELNHTTALHINDVVAQALIAKILGKKCIIDETRAEQHGVATATVCARFGL